MVAPLTIEAVGERAAAVLDEIERVVVGKRAVLEKILVGLLANGHVLIEDFPGVAKTLIARSFAQVSGLGFGRVQFTPDLLPADLIGSPVLDPASGDLRFRPGPLFCHLLLGDEINRAPPKTQSALLEAMQEHQVTVDGVSHRLERPFLVVATQNPLEYEGTYPLPEAQLDRFLLRIQVGYPSREDGWGVLSRRLARDSDDTALTAVTDREGLLAMQAAVESVFVSEPVGYYIVDLVEATRGRPGVEVGASPRGALALMAVARATAALAGRDYVTPEDVKTMAVAALAHRLSLRPELWVRGVKAEHIVQECLDTVPAPVGDPRRGTAVPDATAP